MIVLFGWIRDSDDRMAEARGARQQLQSFVGECQALEAAAAGGVGAAKRFGPAEFQLLAELGEHAGAVEAALGNDFDTPEVLRRLKGLVARAQAYARERPGGKPVLEAWRAVAEYVERVMGIFGVRGVAAEEGRAGGKVRRVGSRAVFV
jgi:cysteinyl-tRNA synthetase